MLYSRAEHLQGSVPAIVIHVKTEFVVDSIDGMIEAVRTAFLIKPGDCRNQIKDNFSVTVLVGKHSDLHEWIVDERTLFHA